MREGRELFVESIEGFHENINSQLATHAIVISTSLVLATGFILQTSRLPRNIIAEEICVPHILHQDFLHTKVCILTRPAGKVQATLFDVGTISLNWKDRKKRLRTVLRSRTRRTPSLPFHPSDFPRISNHNNLSFTVKRPHILTSFTPAGGIFKYRGRCTLPASQDDA